MKIAIDTNVLAYAEGVGDLAREAATHKLLETLQPGNIVIPAQALGELYRVLTGKHGISRNKARTIVLSWADAFDVQDSTYTAFVAALDLATDHRFQMWDGLILSVAAEARCRILLSEDMQHDFTWRGVTVINPYISPIHPLLA